MRCRDIISLMRIRINRLKTVIPLWAGLLLLMSGFLYGTSPDSIGPQGVTAFFIVAYLFTAMTIHVLLLSVVRMLARPGSLNRWRFGYALILAFVPVTAVGLQSLDQLILRDILIFTGLVALIVFYMAKRS